MQMTIVSLLGILAGLLAIPVFFRGATITRLGMAIALVFVHLIVAQLYFGFSKTSAVDAYAYYYAGQYWRQYSWGTLSTVFVGHVTQLLKIQLGASYIDCFMVFQAFGTWGLVILLRSFQEIYQKMDVTDAPLPLFLLFIPSIHFWTVAIGKDAPMFFAVSLATWASINLGRRLIPFGFAIAFMVLFRPHVAFATVVALLAASVLHSQLAFGRKAFIMVLGLIGTAFVLAAIEASFKVNLADASSVAQFWESRAAAEAADKSSTSIVGAPYPVRLVTLLFRPFFFDAKNMLGIIASLENVGSVLLFGYLIKQFRVIRYLSKRVLFINFALFYSLILIVMLSLLTYNIGLGLRERAMIMPPLFCLFAAALAYGRKMKAQSSAAAGGAMPAGMTVPARPTGQYPAT